MLDMKREFHAIAEQSVLTWGNWGWFRRNAHRQREWEACAEGNPVPDAAQVRTNRRDLYHYWNRIGFNREYEIRRQERERSRNRMMCRQADCIREHHRNNSGN